MRGIWRDPFEDLLNFRDNKGVELSYLKEGGVPRGRMGITDNITEEEVVKAIKNSEESKERKRGHVKGIRRLV